MDSGNVKDLAKYRYEKALSNIRVARALYEDFAYSAALNRAYYSAFDAMRAVNAIDGFDSSKHSGVISHFNQEYVKTGRFPPSSSRIIRQASMMREKSDYEDFFIPESEETIDVIANVEQFLADVRTYLESIGVLEV